MMGHIFGDLLPGGVADAVVYGLVANHCKRLGPRRDKNQDSVVMGQFMNLHCFKSLLCGDQRIGDNLMAYKDVNLAGAASFGAVDRFDDFVMLKAA